MKEYKSISITTGNVMNLGNRLNKYAEKGWYIKDTISNMTMIGDDVWEFIYLMERDKLRIDSSDLVTAYDRRSKQLDNQVRQVREDLNKL